jgi:hypothetical protein
MAVQLARGRHSLYVPKVKPTSLAETPPNQARETGMGTSPKGTAWQTHAVSHNETALGNVGANKQPLLRALGEGMCVAGLEPAPFSVSVCRPLHRARGNVDYSKPRTYQVKAFITLGIYYQLFGRSFHGRHVSIAPGGTRVH